MHAWTLWIDAGAAGYTQKNMRRLSNLKIPGCHCTTKYSAAETLCPLPKVITDTPGSDTCVSMSFTYIITYKHAVSAS